jgi:hypothetical protein
VRLKILNSGGYGPGHAPGGVIPGVMRYPDGGGLTAAERARWEQVRLAAELIGALPEGDDTMTTAVIGATGPTAGTSG